MYESVYQLKFVAQKPMLLEEMHKTNEIDTGVYFI